MSHIRMSHIWMAKICHINESYMNESWGMSHVTHQYGPCQLHNAWPRGKKINCTKNELHILNESRRTCEWVMSHIYRWGTNDSLFVMSHTTLCHVTHHIFLCHTPHQCGLCQLYKRWLKHVSYEWVMQYTLMSHGSWVKSRDKVWCMTYVVWCVTSVVWCVTSQRESSHMWCGVWHMWCGVWHDNVSPVTNQCGPCQLHNESWNRKQWMDTTYESSHVAHTNQSCRTHQWVMSHESWVMRLSHAPVRPLLALQWMTKTFESSHVPSPSSHVPHTNESWVMSHELWVWVMSRTSAALASFTMNGWDVTVAVAKPIVYWHAEGPDDFKLRWVMVIKRVVIHPSCVCSSVLQCVAVCCSVLVVIHPSCVCSSVLQCVAVCCSVLQCVAVCW